MAQDTQQQGQTTDTQQQTQYQVVKYEDVRQLAQESANAAASASVDAVRTALAEGVGQSGTVTLTEEQYQRFSALGAANLHGQVVSIGLSALVAGLLFVLIVTIHWRLR